MARIAALVVAYNSSTEVEGLAASLHADAAASASTVDVHVIDNSGDAGEIDRLSAMPQLASFLPSGANLGYGGGMNALVATLGDDYDWYLICNPDTYHG
jgi:N-acetylglucosaminyl-diphospho-decaprenol L-rhamnosyltransferase